MSREADPQKSLLVDARYLHENLSALRGAASLSNMLETIVQEKAVQRTGNMRGSMDQQQQALGLGTPSTFSGTSPSTRPSPFAKRGLAGLFGNNRNSSVSSLDGGGSPVPGSSTTDLVGSDGGSQVINITPAVAPSPPGTPGTALLSRSQVGLSNGHREKGSLGLGEELESGSRTPDQT